VTFLGSVATSVSLAIAVLFTTFAQPCAAQNLPSVTGTTRAPVDIPQTNLTPIAQPNYGGFSTPGFPTTNFPPSTYSSPAYPTAPAFAGPPPTASLGSPLFDPYSTGANPGTFAPAIPGAAPIPSPQFPGWITGANTGVGGTPVFGPGNPGFGTSTDFQAQGFPASAYPAGSPNTLFPGGLFNGGSFSGSSGGAYNPSRFFQGPRLRYGWLVDGNGPDDVEMNDIDSSLIFALPNFLQSGQPLYVLPSFGIHLIDGPEGSAGADLPGQLYDAFLDTGFQSDPTQLFGVDLGLRVGVFSDFDNTDSDSLRILGKGLATFRLTPYTTIKGGVVYLDRIETKLLPAGGILYQPTPLTRFDIYFPQPKLSQYFRTVGTKDVWAYIAGDYGGGSWAIKRANGSDDSVDINDIRIYLGLEWGQSELIRAGRHTGFFEVGYVFDREVIYKENDQNNFEPGSTFTLRAGFGY